MSVMFNKVNKENHKDAKSTEKQPESPFNSVVKKVLLALGALLLLSTTCAGYAYLLSPEVIRNPTLEHYHFRMQVLVDGKAENFGEEKYQTGYAKDQCSSNLPEQPIHFHDDKDQFVHIHWKGMTGGMVMKYYGWNFIDGLKDALGYKLDAPSYPQRVNIHGNYLPQIPEDANFFIYSGDTNSYKEHSFEDWINKDLEEFFDTKSNFPVANETTQTTLLNRLFPKASARGGIDDGNDGEPVEETQEEKLTRVNNLVGNVVIFVQNNKPSDEQIKDRFNKLEPLPESTCGG